MKVVYIAGPFRSVNPDGSPNMMSIQRNVMAALEAALDVWKAGGAALCPHANTMFFTHADAIPDQVWLDGDLELLTRCDAVYAIPGWVESSGASAEVRFARARQIPVFTYRDSLLSWLKSQ